MGSFLQITYLIALGVIVATFTQVTIFTFLKRPADPRLPYPGESATKEERQEYEDVQADHRDKMENFYGVAAICALVASIIYLGFGLALADQLKVLADGVLLGGLIVLICSVYSAVSRAQKMARFVVTFVCLLVALALGYFKFLR